MRNLYAEQAIPLGDMLRRGQAPVLARTEIDYLAPVRFPDVVDARMWLEKAERARFVLGAEFLSRTGGRMTARARQIGVFVSTMTGRCRCRMNIRTIDR